MKKVIFSFFILACLMVLTRSAFVLGGISAVSNTCNQLPLFVRIQVPACAAVDKLSDTWSRL